MEPRFHQRLQVQLHDRLGDAVCDRWHPQDPDSKTLSSYRFLTGYTINQVTNCFTVLPVKVVQRLWEERLGHVRELAQARQWIEMRPTYVCIAMSPCGYVLLYPEVPESYSGASWDHTRGSRGSFGGHSRSPAPL